MKGLENLIGILKMPIIFRFRITCYFQNQRLSVNDFVNDWEIFYLNMYYQCLGPPSMGL